MGSVLYLEGGVDAADEGVQYVDALVSVEEDEGEESLQQSRLGHTPQEEVEVRRGGHHLLQCQLHRGRRTRSVTSTSRASINTVPEKNTVQMSTNLVESRSEDRHEESVVDVTNQLVSDIRMSHLESG